MPLISLISPSSFLSHTTMYSSQENSSLTTQVTSLNKSLLESQEQVSRLKSELHKTKSAAKSPVGDARASDLEERLRMAEEENMSLQVCTCMHFYSHDYAVMIPVGCKYMYVYTLYVHVHAYTCSNCTCTCTCVIVQCYLT